MQKLFLSLCAVLAASVVAEAQTREQALTKAIGDLEQPFNGTFCGAGFVLLTEEGVRKTVDGKLAIRLFTNPREFQIQNAQLKIGNDIEAFGKLLKFQIGEKGELSSRTLSTGRISAQVVLIVETKVDNEIDTRIEYLGDNKIAFYRTTRNLKDGTSVEERFPELSKRSDCRIN